VRAGGTDVTPGRYVTVIVTDTGTGIEPEQLSQLFDPFFTTKSSGEASGLGLALVWGFVTQSGGHVAVYSEQGIGTSFKLYLPVTDDDVRSEPDSTGERTTSGRTAEILVAEDDPDVRAFATQLLRRQGHTVHAAANGPEALDVLERVTHIDLLFTDVIMPGGMSGRDLADEVVRRRPDTRVLFASGYSENVIMHDGRVDEGVLLLAKPYTGRQLAHRVADALDGESS